MDLAQILRELSRRRGWVVVGAIVAVLAGVLTAYRPAGFPPTLETRALELGAAKTQVLLDVPRSSLVDPEVDLEDVTVRAPVYADVMATESQSREIARRADIPFAQLSTATSGQQEPGAQERSSQLLDESRPYSLLIKAGGASPLIEIFSQGPDADRAARLANAAAAELKAYTESLKTDERTAPRSIVAKQLGRATGGVTNSGVNKMVTVLATMGTFIAALLLILLASSVLASYRRLRMAGAAWPGGTMSGGTPNGDGGVRPDGQAPTYEQGTAQQEPDLASVRSLRRR